MFILTLVQLSMYLIKLLTKNVIGLSIDIVHDYLDIIIFQFSKGLWTLIPDDFNNFSQLRRLQILRVLTELNFFLVGDFLVTLNISELLLHGIISGIVLPVLKVFFED